MTDLPALRDDHQPLLPGPALQAARAYAEKSLSPATRRAYKRDWEAFCRWCAQHRLQELPAAPLTIATYAAHMAQQGHAVAYIERNLSGIRRAHSLAKAGNPCRSDEVYTVMQGIRREHRGVSRKDPILRDQLEAAVAASPNNLAGWRDRALLLVGWVCALRRSELVAAEVEHLEERPEGLILTLPTSKTNQTGEKDEWVAIPKSAVLERCPVQALRAWLEAAQIKTGPLFRSVLRGQVWGRLSDRAAAEVVKRAMRRAGIAGNWGAHSLRAGYATQAALEERPAETIMAQTRHESFQVLKGYIRRAKANAFKASKGML